MAVILASLAISFAASLVLTPLVRWLGLAAGAVDHPNHRKVHSRSVSRLGGVAIFAAFWTPLFLALFFRDLSSLKDVAVWSPRLLGFMACSSVLLVMGVVDDFRGLSARSKIPIEVALGCAMYFCGFGIKVVTVPLLGGLDIGPLALPFTVLWFVGIVNAINLIDGIDGAAAGVSAIAAISLAAAMPPGIIKPLLLALCLIGASCGFLVHNFPPARIFMGDAGSLFLGFTLATLATMAHHKSTATVAMLVPIAALAVPIADTASAVVRRLLHRRPVLSADDGHVHHRLLALGLSTRKSVLLLYLVTALCGLAAVNIARAGGSRALVLTALLGVLLAAVLYKLGILRPSRSARAKPRDEASSEPAGSATNPGAGATRAD